MNEAKQTPKKPPGILWAFSLLLIFGGLLWLYDFLDHRYIIVSRVNTGERYTGSVAVSVIAVTLCVGFALLAHTVWRWRAYRKAL